ncbi:MAG TPA: c-type cytochrome domain-containing protein [Gemmataceae bacterium]|nr:c-type cytochrome domain-containing protein [Gemmataceae bacterium]
MQRLSATGVLVLAFLGWGGAASAADDPPAPPSYVNDIKPFLNSYCMRCHSDARPRSGVAVETFADLTKSGRRGTLVVPQKPDDSRLLAVLTGHGRQMPPGRSPQPKAEEVAKVRDWITAGAKDDTPAPADVDKKTPSPDPGK